MAIKVTETVLCNECLALEPPQEVEGTELLIGGVFKAHACPKHKKAADAAQKYIEEHTEYVPMQSVRQRKGSSSSSIKADGNEPAKADEYFKCGDCGNVVKKVTKYTHAKSRHNKSTKDIEWTPTERAA